MPSAGSAKAALRGEMLARRRGMTPGEAAMLSRRIVESLQRLPILDRGASGAGRPLKILGYYPVRQEASGLAWLEERLGQGDLVALPRLPDGEEMIEARAVASLLVVQAGAYGIPAPPADAPLVPPGAVDVCLVPGLAFDRQGHRLGHGGGYYDRYLGQLRPDCLKVALAFAWQIVDRIPFDAWDRPVDLIITEEGIMATR